MNYEDIISRHKKIALQFSGGKDSLATLFLMEPYWNRLTVYHLDTGDVLPETKKLVDEVAEIVPRFRRVQSNVRSIWDAYGYPTNDNKIRCCALTIMIPLNEQMLTDKITLLIRGQKLADKVKGPFKTGDRAGNFEFLYPLDDWTDDDVFRYLETLEVQLPAYYLEGCTSAPDCMMCTAWTEHHGQEYVIRHYPHVADELKERMRTAYAH